MDITAQTPGEKKLLERAVLISASLTAFLASFLASAINLALPTIGYEFNANAVELGWVMSSYTLTSAMFLLPFGKLGDIAGRKRIFALGVFLFVVSTFFIIFARTIIFVIIMRMIQGFSGAMIFSTSMAIITAVFGPGERGKALGLYITSVYIGFMSGPVLGGLLTQYFGWRSIFLFLVPFQVLSLVLIKRRIKIEWADAAGDQFDWKGTLVFSLALLTFMYGFSILPSLFGWISLGTSLSLAVLFVFIELKAVNPIFEFELILKNRMFALSSLAALINYSATSSIGLFVSLYLQHLRGFDARVAGFIMIFQPLAMSLLSPLAGRLSDKHKPGTIASIGLALIALGLILFCFINEYTHIAKLIVILLFLGAGFGLFSSPNANAIMSSVEKKHLGIASGVLGTMRNIGQMVSMGISMMLLALFIGREPINPSNYPALLQTIRTGVLCFAIFSIMSIIVSIARNKQVK